LRTFGTSRDNGRNRVPRLGPPTMRIAFASPIIRYKIRSDQDELLEEMRRRLSKGCVVLCAGGKEGKWRRARATWLWEISCLAGEGTWTNESARTFVPNYSVV